MARTVRVKELSLESFAPYGTFANMINPNTPKIGGEPIEFFRDMVPHELGTTYSSYSICRVQKRPLVIDVTEYHTVCGEVEMPLDGDVLIHVGVATPLGDIPIDEFEVFRVPSGTLVSLRPGVWHHAPYTVSGETVNVLIVLPERTYANDCEVYELAEDEVIEIQL